MTNAPLTRPTRTAPMGPSNGMSEMVSAADAPLMPSDVRVVFGVGGEDEGDDLGLTAEAIREHGAHGAVNLAAGEDFTLAGTAFALDEAAGDASAGVGVFAIIDGQRGRNRCPRGDQGWRWRWRERRCRQCAPRPNRAPAWLIFRFQMRWFYRRQVQQILLVS